VDAVLLALAAAAGAGALWWHQSRPARVRAQLGSAFDADAEVALHVAGHEARSRAQALSSLHMLYGLVQDEVIVGAIRDAGHDPEALEDRILAGLDATARSTELTEEIDYVYGRALHSAYAANRKVTCRDLWAYLALSDAAVLLDASDIDHTVILFRLCHGAADPVATPAGPGDVHVVLRNDDYTTREFVCGLLERIFAFTAGDAEAVMMQTHTQGRGVVGRFALAEARAKVREVRELANTHGFPLWIGIEPI
jgi:ATP-dependent Clp protease adaptor protein ClpS